MFRFTRRSFFRRGLPLSISLISAYPNDSLKFVALDGVLFKFLCGLIWSMPAYQDCRDPGKSYGSRFGSFSNSFHRSRSRAGLFQLIVIRSGRIPMFSETDV